MVVKDRGKIPIGWAADPYLGTPELWNFYARIRLKTILLLMVWILQHIFKFLGSHAKAYDMRAGKVLNQSGISVVDVGVASNKWPAATKSKIEQYVSMHSRAIMGNLTTRDDIECVWIFMNQPVNFWLDDGTPVINSICVGPKGDTSMVTICIIIGILNQTNPARTWQIESHGHQTVIKIG